MQRLAVALLLGPATANNIVNPTTKMCLEPMESQKGASLSMQPCKEDASQNFAVIGGRVMSLATSEELCIDIKALCQDGTDVPGCPRQDVSQLKEDAEIQLWTCRKDDEQGRSSSSYGNQKWDMLSNGYIKNELTGLCLVAHHQGPEKGQVHVHTCPAVTDPEFVLDLETGNLAVETNSPGASTAASLSATGTATMLPAGGGKHDCPQHGICGDNQCMGKSCLVVLSEKMEIASDRLDGDTGSNNPAAKTLHATCAVAMQLLFHECEMCRPGPAGCPSKLFSVVEAAAGHLSIGTSRTGVAVVTGLAAAAALAATLAIARSRRAAAQPQLLQELDEAVDTTEISAMKTEA